MFVGEEERLGCSIFPGQRETETLRDILEEHLHADGTASRGACHLPFPCLVIISPKHISPFQARHG